MSDATERFTSLKKNQSIDYINIEVATSGGFILRFETRTQTPQKEYNGWTAYTEVFGEDKVDEAFERVVELYKIKLGISGDKAKKDK